MSRDHYRHAITLPCAKLWPSWIFKMFIFDHVADIEYQNVLLYTKFHRNQMMYRWDMAILRFSKWRMSAILNFRGSIMGSLKRPCITSYRSSIETVALNCLVSEKIAFYVCILATDRRTDKQTNRWTAPKHKAAACCREWWLNPLDSKAIIVPHRIIRSWYTGRWWVGCYIWYSKEGPGRAAAPPSPLLLAVSNVTAHPSTANVPITVLLYDSPLLCGFNVAIKGLICYTNATDDDDHDGNDDAPDFWLVCVCLLFIMCILWLCVLLFQFIFY